MIAFLSRMGLLSLALALCVGPAAACVVAAPPTHDLGSFSPGAIKDLAVTPVGKSGGINCSGTVLSLLGGNSLTATISNTNSFKLSSTTTKTEGTFQIYPSATSQTVFAENVAVNFLNPQVLDLLGLLGNSPSVIPLYIKPVSTDALMPGVYQGSFKVSWSWRFCSIAWVGNLCAGTRVVGSQSADIAFTVTVAAKPLTVAISSVTTWDPVTFTTNPKAIVGAKQRMTITVSNPDIIPADPNSVKIDLPLQAGTAIALDGDGASGGGAIKFSDGFPASSLAFSYTGAGDMGDDVDFFSAGIGWSYVPTPGDLPSQSLVTKIRLKPRGAFAPGSSFSITLPFVVR